MTVTEAARALVEALRKYDRALQMYGLMSGGGPAQSRLLDRLYGDVLAALAGVEAALNEE